MQTQKSDFLVSDN